MNQHGVLDDQEDDGRKDEGHHGGQEPKDDDAHEPVVADHVGIDTRFHFFVPSNGAADLSWVDDHSATDQSSDCYKDTGSIKIWNYTDLICYWYYNIKGLEYICSTTTNL